MHTFPHRTFAICKVPTVNPSGKNQRFLPAPFGKGAFGCGIGGFPPNLLHIPSSLFPKKARYRSYGAWLGADNHQQVPAHPQAVSLAPAGSLRHLRCQLPPGGSYGVHTFPHRTFAICKVPTVNPSGKNQRFLPAPFNKGALRAVPAANFAPSWSVIVLALTRPVSLLRWKLGCRYSLSSTNPKANRQLSSRWLPQAPAVPAPSRRELWGAYLSTSDFCNM